MVNFLDALRVIHNASVVQNYGLLMLILYLTDVWGVGIIHATSLINIWVAITKIMPLIFLFLMDNYIGTYSMLLISTTASAMGMGLLSISTPSRLYSLITGSCSEYNMKCITQTQQSLFYVALVLIMLGRSACAATMLTLNFKGNDDDEKELRKQFVTSASGYAALQASILALTPWSVVFAVPSLYNLIAISLLTEKSWSHKLYISNPERSPISSVVRVIVASFSKRPLKMKRDEEAQAFVRMLPVVVMYGFFALISTTCTTYFLQQAKRLKPSFFFRMEYIEVAYIVWYLFDEVVIRNNTYNKKRLLITLAKDAMINAITCCAIAAVVELSRLRVIRNYGVSNNPDEIIPMSRLWLLPQFGMLIYFVTSLDPIRQMFFVEDMSLPMKNFKVCVFEGFIGIAIIGSVLVVHLVGNISLQMGDAENSRSDLFYWALTVCLLVLTIWFKGSNYFNSRRGHPISPQIEERKYKRR